MNHQLPHAASVPRCEDRDRITEQARRKFSAGFANDTQWNQLIDYIRGQSWRPSYRSKWINGHISEWDVEWSYHLPFPFVGVEWFDIGLQSYGEATAQSPAPLLDRTVEIVAKLTEIGFEFEVRVDVVRIWGYYPKCFADFPPK